MIGAVDEESKGICELNGNELDGRAEVGGTNEVDEIFFEVEK